MKQASDLFSALVASHTCAKKPDAAETAIHIELKH